MEEGLMNTAEQAVLTDCETEVAASLQGGELYSAEEVEALRESYPDFDLELQMQDPVFRGLTRGEIKPNLRMIYEMCHHGEIVRQQAAEAVDAAVAEAVEKAVAEAVGRTRTETEQRVLSHIRARGQRPQESGLRAALGVRIHPAVDRLTKADRERLARRASRGETVRL